MTADPVHGDPDLPDFDDVARALDKHVEEKGPFAIELNAAMAFMVISQIQVAIRHPENSGASAQFAVDFAHLLTQQLPEIAQTVVAAGWDVRQDVPVGEDDG